MKEEIDFIGKSRKFGMLSTILVVVSLGLIVFKGVERNVDFAGGTQVTVKFADNGIKDGDLREQVTKVDSKASVVRVESETGSRFTIKIKNPDVEEGNEDEAAQQRRRGLDQAFAAVTGETEQLLGLLKGISGEKLTAYLVLQNPYNISDTDERLQSIYGGLAASIKANVASAATLEDLVAKSETDPEKHHKLVGGLVLTFPDLNHLTPDLLKALLKKYNPLNRDSSDNYDEVADHVIAARTAKEDFLGGIDDFTGDLPVRQGEDAEVLKAFFHETFTSSSYTIIANETFSPSIAAELLSNAWSAVLLALLGILLYVSARFTVGYAVSSIVALVHDVIIALGCFSLIGAELSNPVVAAFLTIVGYSLNDTIVVFDRIRDNLNGPKRSDLAALMNTSINQTLSRTLVTSMTTFFVVSVIYWGSNNATLQDFAFPLLVGIVVGTYSSIFVASPCLLFWNNKFKPIAG